MSRAIARAIGVIVVLAGLTGCAAPTAAPMAARPLPNGMMMVQVPAAPVPGSREPAGPLPARLWLPPGDGPSPMVILLHGCGGIGSGATLDAWAHRLMSWGYGAIIPDSLGPRGIASVCAPANQPKVTAVDRAGDVIDTARFLQTLPRADGTRIGVLGESHGGGTATTVTRSYFENLQPGLLKAAVDYYGPCRDPSLHGHVPLLALAGDADDWGQPAVTCRNFGAALRPDQPFELEVYPGVVHAFDNPALVTRRYNEGHAMQYDAAAAQASIARVRAFLDRWVRGTPPA